MTKAWWHPDHFARQRPYLAARNKVIKAIRAYFDGQGVEEVETPILQTCPVMDTHIHGFGTALQGVDLQVKKTLYLHTSPEFGMKKLLVAGMENIYQICHVFRNAEDSKRHSVEFSMLEWYRAGGDGYEQIKRDCEGLLPAIARACGITHFRHNGHECDAFAAIRYLRVADAFRDYSGIDLDRYLDDRNAFAAVIAGQGIRVADDDRWDDLFFRVMAEKIEPHLGMDGPVALMDYPICMASLARPCADDPRYAARFELYICGLELANAFNELTDPALQRERFETEMAAKKEIYGTTYPVDEDFLAALEHGMPDSGGIALGIDRLVMLATGATHIEQVLWAPVDRD